MIDRILFYADHTRRSDELDPRARHPWAADDRGLATAVASALNRGEVRVDQANSLERRLFAVDEAGLENRVVCVAPVP